LFAKRHRGPDDTNFAQRTIGGAAPSPAPEAASFPSLEELDRTFKLTPGTCREYAETLLAEAQGHFTTANS
jgi:hypothetical protein